jgi:hypothetical protein
MFVQNRKSTALAPLLDMLWVIQSGHAPQHASWLYSRTIVKDMPRVMQP